MSATLNRMGSSVNQVVRWSNEAKRKGARLPHAVSSQADLRDVAVPVSTWLSRSGVVAHAVQVVRSAGHKGPLRVERGGGSQIMTECRGCP